MADRPLSALSPSRIPANAGITLSRSGQSLLARPKTPAAQLAAPVVSPKPSPGNSTATSKLAGSSVSSPLPAMPIALPRLDALLLESLAAPVRYVWKHYGRRCGWALYLDLATGMWQPLLPPQLAGASDVMFDLSFASCPQAVPPPTWRLAGSVRAAEMDDGESIMAAVPPVDGLHVVLFPEVDWLSLMTFVHLNGQVEQVNADQVIAEPVCRLCGELLNARVRLETPSEATKPPG